MERCADCGWVPSEEEAVIVEDCQVCGGELVPGGSFDNEDFEDDD